MTGRESLANRFIRLATAPIMSGADLRAWRKANGLTQAEAAEWWHGEPGHVRTWRRWENEESRVPRPLSNRIRAIGAGLPIITAKSLVDEVNARLK